MSDMKKIVSVIVSVMCAIFADAQTKDRDVVASGGGYATTSGAQVSFTVGESVIQYHAQPGASLSQGFQQPNSSTTSVLNVMGSDVTLNVYPNPFIRTIEVNSEKQLKGASFRLTDVSGKEIKMVAREQHAGTRWRIALDNIAAGNYWLTIEAQGKQVIHPLTHIAQ
jgi:hypothetical protein